MTRTQAPENEWTSNPEGLRLGDALVTFQRFPIPPGGGVDRIPRSCGVLPVAPAPAGFVLPLAEDEAFWIGVMAPKGKPADPFSARALIGQGRWLDAAVSAQSGIVAVIGVPRPDGTCGVFSRPETTAVCVEIAGRRARIDLTDPDTFERIAGRPKPEALDPTAAYGGWRLP